MREKEVKVREATSTVWVCRLDSLDSEDHRQRLTQLHCIAWVKCKCSVKQNCHTAGKEDSPVCVATKQEVTPAQPHGEI